MGWQTGCMTSETSMPMPMVCGLCLRGLNRFNGQWVHLQVPDHLPQPVPQVEAMAKRYVCDFCSTPHVKWVFFSEEYRRDDRVVHERGEFGKPVPLTPKTSVREREVVSAENLHSSMGQRWAACDPCADLVDRREVGYLVRRVKKAEPRVQTSFLKRHFTDLFRQIRGKTAFYAPDAVEDAADDADPQ